MAMNQQDRDRDVNFNEQMQSTLRGQRRRVEELARMLSQQSIEQWQRAVEGIVALPAALVTSVAASTLFTVGFVTRGFEVFQDAARDYDERGRYMAGRDGERGERHDLGDRERRDLGERGERRDNNEQRSIGTGGEQQMPRA